MLLGQALDTVHKFTSKEFSALSELLSPELINECLVDTGVATIRKRRLPMEMMVWAVTGMTLFRSLSMNQLVSHLDILLPGKRPFVAPGAVVQARQRLGRCHQERIRKNKPALVRKKAAVALERADAHGSRWNPVANAGYTGK